MTRAPIQREHIYQAALHKWAREYVLGPKKFFAFDRAKAPGRSKGAKIGAIARQNARGVKKGAPDTLLRVKGFPPIWWECKGPDNKVKDGDDQHTMGLDLIELGDHWGWGITVEQYAVMLVNIGVPLARNWLAAVYQADAGIIAKIERAEMKAGQLPKRYKVREDKPTAGRVKKVHEARTRVMF